MTQEYNFTEEDILYAQTHVKKNMDMGELPAPQHPHVIRFLARMWVKKERGLTRLPKPTNLEVEDVTYEIIHQFSKRAYDERRNQMILAEPTVANAVEKMTGNEIYEQKKPAARTKGSVSRNKGKPFARIIRTIIRDGREHVLHATKGWRSYRIVT